MFKVFFASLFMMMAVAVAVSAAPVNGKGNKKTLAVEFCVWADEGAKVSKADCVKICDALFENLKNDSYTTEREILMNIFFNKENDIYMVIAEANLRDTRVGDMFFSGAMTFPDGKRTEKYFFTDADQVIFFLEQTLAHTKDPSVIYESETKYITHK